MERIEGVTVSVYDVDFIERIREYQDPQGWAVSDIGTNEDEIGYYFSQEMRGPGGEPRNLTITLTRKALQAMLDRVNARFPTKNLWTETWLDTSWIDRNTKASASPMSFKLEDDYSYGDVTLGDALLDEGIKCCGGTCC